MTAVVNLRLARKRKARADAEADAATNRAAHGVPKAARRLAAAARDREDRTLDGHERTDPKDG